MIKWQLIAATLGLLWFNLAAADSAESRCDIYPKGEDKATKMIPCVFSQRQGYITIRSSDGVTHELSPVGDSPGNYRDQDGHAVYRQQGLGEDGQIYRMPTESVYVYWDASVLDAPADEDNPTAPFSIKDFDATTLLRCKAKGDSEFGNCPAGISRMEDGQASITVQNQLGEKFTINFMTGYVNATNREVEAKKKGDTWILHFANGEVWEVPLAAIEGG